MSITRLIIVAIMVTAGVLTKYAIIPSSAPDIEETIWFVGAIIIACR